MKKHIHCTLLILLFINSFLTLQVHGQQRKIDVGDRNLWQIYDRDLQFTAKDTMGFAPSDSIGQWVLKNEELSLSAIEFDVKGENSMNNNFVGIAFNMQDLRTFETIYFRPFNFFNPDTVRRPRSVQYMYLPDYPWPRLREEHPGKYENRILKTPDPDQWFHVKITIDHPEIKVFVNNNPTPSLVVNSLSTRTKGKIGFWMQGKSRGSFANLVITPAQTSKKVSYGNNPAAGKYLQVGDASLYYEVYGKGRPVLLLHGGVYGYIDEFEPLIDELAKTNLVICPATRGHGRSQIGNTPFTWQQRAEDAYKIVRSITKEKVAVIGFSDGAAAAYKLAAIHPELVTSLVAIGFGNKSKDSARTIFNYTPELLMGQAPELFNSRKSLMPQPERWGQCLAWLNQLYNNEILSQETFTKIKCPVLVMTGEKDQYHTVASVTSVSKMIPGSKLSVIEGCGHVVIGCNFPAVWGSIKPFIASPRSGS
ncbi:alpha/beta hydrolase [Paraflavitalea soli]|uniref:Alpha/beta hydrolase n=1 Tax=Paraflavitalea soli TaxID=2315862 RepID=A0A3B7MMG7_9BACT|nr:alpha/beta hydrolase [Paraflavitalea soli]AXY75318.1 alpha/beta hydrolase [Paraflavitalea soli]